MFYENQKSELLKNHIDLNKNKPTILMSSCLLGKYCGCSEHSAKQGKLTELAETGKVVSFCQNKKNWTFENVLEMFNHFDATAVVLKSGNDMTLAKELSNRGISVYSEKDIENPLVWKKLCL